MQKGLLALRRDKESRKDPVTDGGHQKNASVQHGRKGGKVVFAHPSVTKGRSDSQKSKCRLAQRTFRLTCPAAWSR